MTRCHWFLAGLLLLSGVTSSLAAGFIVVHDERHWPGPRPPRPPIIVPPPRPIPVPAPVPLRPIELARQQVNTDIQDQIARTTVEQVFHNPNSRQLEGTFFFPVPKGAQLDGFTLEIDGRQTEAELLEAAKARKIYEDIVRSLRDPALLEYAGRDVFKVRIFPFAPHSKRAITVTYTQVLKSDGGLIEYVCPLSATKSSGAASPALGARVQLTTKAPLKSVWSPSHDLRIERRERGATLTWDGAAGVSGADLQLYFSTGAGAFGADLLTHHTGGDDGYFLLLLTPELKNRKERTTPKDVTFVLDTSGSMAGKKLEQAKKALQFCVENLNDEDRFEVLKFATDVEPLFDQLVPATEKHRDAAREFITRLKPLGSTAIDDALRRALASRPADSERPHVVIFLTDGRPTIGVTRENEIVDNVARLNSALTRIFCFGIGTDVNTHLLDKITETTKSFSQYVLPDEDLEVKLSAFFTKFKEPALADVRLEFPDGVRIAKLYPHPLPDVFKGDQLVLAGRYSGNGEGRLILSGLVDGKRQKHAFTLGFPERSTRNGFIPRLWATRRVGYLLDEIRLRGENAELKDEVTQLAREFGIVTPYTAYLIVEDERRREVTLNRRLLPQLEQDRAAGQVIERFNQAFREQKSGNAAVAGAQANFDLKSAQSADAARQRASTSLGRAVTVSTPARPTGGPVSGGGSGGTSVAGADTRAMAYTRQNRFVAGKSFYQNGARWVDALVQTLPNTTPRRVRFGSGEYFDLLTRHPEAAPWLSLGNQLLLVIAGEVIEIHD